MTMGYLCINCGKPMQEREGKSMCENEKCDLFFLFIPDKLSEPILKIVSENRRVRKRNAGLEKGEICTWKAYRRHTHPSWSDLFYLHKTSCDQVRGLGGNEISDKVFHFCPYCGRRIKYINEGGSKWRLYAKLYGMDNLTRRSTHDTN